LPSLNEAERKVLDYSSAMGKKFDFNVLMVALDMSEEELAEILEHLVHKGVCREVAGGDEYHFTSDQILTDTQKEISSSRMRVIHKKLGEAYQELYEHPRTEIVHLMARHFYLGKVHDKSVLYNRYSAALARENFSPGVAIRYLQRVRDDLSAMDDDHRLVEADVLRELGDIQADMGDSTRADELYGMSLEKLPEDQNALRALILLARAEAARNMDQLTRAKDLCKMAMAEFEQTGRKKALAVAHKLLAKVAFKEGTYDIGREEIEASLELLDIKEDAREVGRCFIDLGNLYMRYNSSEDQELGKEYFRKAIAVLEPLKDFHELFRAHNNMAVMAADTDPKTAIRELEIARRYAEMAKDRRSVGWALFNSVEYLLSLGKAAEAEKANAEAEAILSEVGDLSGLQQVALNKGILGQYAKDYDRAEKGYRDSLRRAENMGYLHYASENHIRLARMYLEVGRMYDARREMAIAEELGEEKVLPTLMTVYRDLQRKLGMSPPDHARNDQARFAGDRSSSY
jgi:tetratricopeptide (TPR) repeat protein